jgi:hypothetical protein
MPPSDCGVHELAEYANFSLSDCGVHELAEYANFSLFSERFFTYPILSGFPESIAGFMSKITTYYVASLDRVALQTNT